MNEQLQRLIELQEIDSQLIALQRRRDSLPAPDESVLQKALASVEELQRYYASLEKRKRDKEHQIDDINDKVEKLKQRSSEIKTNKEYQAHIKEIEATAQGVRAIEDEILALMESLEETAKQNKETEAFLSLERARVEQQRTAVEKERNQCDVEMKGIKEARRTAAAVIESPLYNRYMVLLKRGGGRAVGEARNEICTGCNLHIPPQMFVELKSNNEITECPQCNRILYYVRPEGEAQPPEEISPATDNEQLSPEEA